MPRFEDHRGHLEALIAAVRRECDPAALVAAHVRAVAARKDVTPIGIAVGKAALGMADGMIAGAGGWCGPIIVPHGSARGRDAPAARNNILVEADHPLPDLNSREAGRWAVWQVSPGWREDFVSIQLWILLSGGASALMVDPPPEITINDYRAVVGALLRAGATIHELNAVRKHIDRVKGGWLARRAGDVAIHLLALSDVPGDDLSVIGSGPVAADPTTFADAFDVLLRHGCVDVAPAVSAWLRAGMRGEHPETPKPGDAALSRVTSHIVGSNGTAVHAATEGVAALGFRPAGSRRDVQGEAAGVGGELGRVSREVTGRPAAIVWGGETTVTVREATGKGGRNQEVALAAAIQIDGRAGIAISTFATDGVDGPTDAAGATVTGETCGLARAAGLDAAAALANHDSYGFFELLDRAYPGRPPHLIRTGPTGTNVNDIAVGLVY